ncbi:MAG: universal stress protein [Candidatus Bathyarchaeota archaeon]|nr:universal stress protein [Candidatus Bathyarchaeota archaeon]
MNNTKNRKQEEKQTKEQGKTWILVAVDNSEYAKTVAEEAAKVALEKKANVVFLSVVPIPSLVASEGEFSSEYLNEKEKEFQNLHNKLIDSNFKPDSGILVESKILHGNPPDKIVKYADEIDADLIIMGNKGQGKLANVLLGSVSEHVVHHSKRSVLIVKKKN